MNESRFDSNTDQRETFSDATKRGYKQQSDFGSEVISRIKEFAVDKPLAVVIAGLAVGVLSGFMLKRR